MNSQTFTLLVVLAFAVIIIVALKQHLKYKDAREQEEKQMRAFAAQRAKERQEEQESLAERRGEKAAESLSGLRRSYEPLEIEVVGRDVYEEKVRRATAGLYGGKRSRYYGGFGLDGFTADDIDLPDDLDFDGDWDRDAAILAAQQNLRLMREEDLNYAMDDIEAQILNMDHAPTEDELIGIADSAADFYDMSEDYRDY